MALAASVALLPTATATAAILQDDLTYREVEGVSITLDLYQPASPGPYPGVLLIHGAWDHETKESYSELATQLADHGFVVYVPDYRAACDPVNSGGIDPALCGYEWNSTVEDLMDAMTWVRAHAAEHDTVATQIAAWGGSGGGLLANHLGTRGTPGGTRPEVVISWSGFTAIYDYESSGDPDRVKSGMKDFVGCPLEGTGSCPDQWVAASPLTYVGAGDAPTYLANSSAEVTPVENATDMAVALEASGVTASLRVVPGDLHSRQLSSVVVDPSGTTVLAESELFLREHLDAAPSVFATDPVVVETDGTVSATSTLRVIPPATGAVTVSWATTDRTASAGTDYVAASGVATIPAGQTQAVLSLTLLGDDLIEGDEWFDVLLSAPNGASLGDAHATVYIDENDVPTGPVVTGVTPNAGKVGTSVTIAGSGFSGASDVSFGSTPAAFTVVSDTQLTTTIPSGALTAPVMVTTPMGTATGPTVRVRPTILSFAPSNGPVGTKVTISGTAFTGTTSVTIGGVAARSVKVISYGTLSVKVAPGTVTGKIVVTATGGQATSKTAFTMA